MERGGDAFHRFRGHANPPPASSEMNQVEANAAATGPAGAGSGRATPPSPAALREQDQYMPIANVIRIMRRILPAHAKISDDAKETIQECVSEYISFVTGEANDRCQREQRKTVTAEDVLWAMAKLGFDDYVEPLTIFLNRYREVECDRTSLRGEPGPFVKRAVVDYGPMGHRPPPPPPNYVPAFQQMGPGPGAFNGGYFGPEDGPTGGSASSSQADMLNGFDPYGQFK